MRTTPHAAFAIAPLLLALAACLVPALSTAGDTSAAAQLQQWSAQAGAPGQAARGQALFNTRQGGEWSCASCHGMPPTAQGKHANTGKAIAPLAPAFNAERFTDSAKVGKWFRRNCNDVFSRECSAAEKADVLAYLLSLKP
jgi:cytochrome c553